MYFIYCQGTVNEIFYELEILSSKMCCRIA